MADYRITYIKPDSADVDRRIDKLGGTGWEAPIDHVIYWIKNGVHRFWTMVDGRSVWVVVKRHPQTQREFLATEADGFPPNNLLRLPRMA